MTAHRHSQRSIIHLNITDFAASVETCLAPGLKGSPVVIAPTGAPRAVVYDMNENAFKEGIRKGMSLTRVQRNHPGIPILPPRFNRYQGIMKEIFKRSLAYTPAIEFGNLDGHIFLDVTGTGRLFGPPPDVAFRLKKEIKKEMGLDPIWSLATNKLVAKVATRMVKPHGEYIVGPGEEKDFLAPLPIALLPGLSQKELKKITQFNLIYISQIRNLTLGQLAIPFAKRADQVHGLIRGIDPTPVAKSRNHTLEANHEFDTDTNEFSHLKAGLSPMVDCLCQALRRQNCSTEKLTITLSYSDGVCREKTAALASPTANELLMFKPACDLLFRAWSRRVRIRHMGLSCNKAPGLAAQASLFPDAGVQKSFRATAKADQVIKAMDKIRNRFGHPLISTGAALESPARLTVGT